MEYSSRIEKMLAPYGYEVACKFFDAFNIFYFVDHFTHVKKGSCIRFRNERGDFGFDDPNTFSFQIEKSNPYHQVNCRVVTFKNSEDELINKFDRFMRMKIFL